MPTAQQANWPPGRPGALELGRTAAIFQLGTDISPRKARPQHRQARLDRAEAVGQRPRAASSPSPSTAAMASAASSRLADSESTHALTRSSPALPFSISSGNRRIQARTVSYLHTLA